ncbi:MAG: acyl-CoA dehydratase activase [Candidatus Methylomirabilales bacterium]
MRPAIRVGLDVGAVAVKAALLAEPEDRDLLERVVRAAGFAWLPAPRPLVVSPYRRVLGDPVGAAEALLSSLRSSLPDRDLDVVATGRAARLLLDRGAGSRVNECKAAAAAVAFLHPAVATVFEMGGESSRFLRLPGAGRPALLDYETNGDCAAGTGAFIDQQASRLGYRVEDVGEIARAARSAARIAGRCSVFAKSDMIHAQQKGAGPPEILRGLCDAVARNFKASITKGKPVVPPVAFIGGLAANAGVVQALRELFRLDEMQFLVPDAAAWFGAIGAALLGAPPARSDARHPAPRPAAAAPSEERHTAQPLSLEHVLLLRDRVRPPRLPEPGSRAEAYLGIDVGSISTNLVVLDAAGEVLHEIYARTQGRPIQVVRDGLAAIREALGDRVAIRGAGTTGSGRELTGELVGADTVTDEITAHTTGAMHVARTLLGATVDTIFEIGGQDAKFIAVQDGVVVDFAMNEACAAGTGSFLEEQAERLGVSIQEEFSRLAFRSRRPARLGERCTVFMEQDVHAWQLRGASREDLVAGLAYSVALNYLHRVVRGRRIGEAIYFQGGTAYNDAVAAAFAGILGKRIIVPPHNGVIGAIGMALLAREKARGTGRPTRFRGLDLSAVPFGTRAFVCQGCANACDMQEVTVEGVKTFWGDKCSDRYRKPARSERRPVIPDLLAERRARLLDGYAGPRPGGPRVGIPQALFTHDRFPFWRTLLESLGCAVVLSEDTNRRIAQDGVDLTVAEPCYPIRVAHGHVKALLDAGLDFVLVPNVMTFEPAPDTVESQLCPWAQTLPHVLRSVPRLEGMAGRLLMPAVHFGLGEAHAARDLQPLGRALRASRRQTARAVAAAFAAQRRFQAAVETAGRAALAVLEQTGAGGVILVGRGYNIHDRAVNLDIPRKLREYYGVNVLPLDCLPLGELDIRDVHDHVYWHSARRILAAGKLAARLPAVHIVYLTNFKCGPDSYIRHFLGRASGKPFLTLQFDGHGNDAGFLTRCEAYLDSKGMLRWWRTAAAD